MAAPKRRASTRRDFWHKQFHVLTVDMFRTDVGLAVNMTEAELRRSLRRVCSKQELIDEAMGEAEGWDAGAEVMYGRMLKMGGGFVVLIRADKGEFRRAIAHLTHEMVHVSQYLLRARRIPLTEDTEEVHAYLTEHLVETALRKLY